MIRIGQIGVGYWGPNILRNFIDNKDCIVNSVADLSSERRDFVRATYPNINKVTDNSQEIIDDPEIDAVAIVTPAHTHYKLAKKALEAGKHVLIEKPMATKSQDVRKIGDIAKKSKLVAWWDIPFFTIAQ